VSYPDITALADGKPVLIPCGQNNGFKLRPEDLEAAITRRTRAIMPVHLYGQPADMAPIVAIAERHGLAVVEDAAQAHGAEYRGRRCGSFGDAAGFSFYPGKNLGAYGEGGIVTTNRDDVARTVRMLRDWGQERKYHHVLKGFNARLEGVQGAVLRVKLRHLEAWTDARRACAAQYGELLRECEGVVLPSQAAGRRHVFHVYAVRVADRAAFTEFLAERGIQTGIHYPFPVHALPAYADLGYVLGDFPNAELAASQVVSLPMYPELASEQIERVAAAVQEWAMAAVRS
jgi:dTDP-4-amino-4,6-dideoxygalactose transaminase